MHSKQLEKIEYFFYSCLLRKFMQVIIFIDFKFSLKVLQFYFILFSIITLFYQSSQGFVGDLYKSNFCNDFLKIRHIFVILLFISCLTCLCMQILHPLVACAIAKLLDITWAQVGKESSMYFCLGLFLVYVTIYVNVLKFINV